jgi:hypothetical protein
LHIEKLETAVIYSLSFCRRTQNVKTRDVRRTLGALYALCGQKIPKPNGVFVHELGWRTYFAGLASVGAVSLVKSRLRVAGKPLLIAGRPLLIARRPLLIGGRALVVAGKTLAVTGRPLILTC